MLLPLCRPSDWSWGQSVSQQLVSEHTDCYHNIYILGQSPPSIMTIQFSFSLSSNIVTWYQSTSFISFTKALIFSTKSRSIILCQIPLKISSSTRQIKSEFCQSQPSSTYWVTFSYSAFMDLRVLELSIFSSLRSTPASSSLGSPWASSPLQEHNHRLSLLHRSNQIGSLPTASPTPLQRATFLLDKPSNSSTSWASQLSDPTAAMLLLIRSSSERRCNHRRPDFCNHQTM